MLKDVVAMGTLIRTVANSPAVVVKDWLRMGGVAVALGAVIMAISDFLGHYFLVPLNDPFLLDVRGFLSGIEKWTYCVNMDLRLPGLAVADFIESLDGLADMVEGCDPAVMRKLQYHFGVGSMWCAVMAAACRSGYGKTDGQSLGMPACPLAEPVPVTPSLCSRQAASNLLGTLELPCASQTDREQIAAQMRREIEVLKALQGELMTFVRSRQSLASGGKPA